MKRFYIHVLLILLLYPVFFMHLYAQEQGEDVENLQLMDTGVAHMENGEYATADQYFRMAIDNMKVLPTEICYFFGKNSFFLGKYKQSIDWLNKYIELKGVKGEYFDESVELLKKSEQAYLAQQERSSPTRQDAATAEKQSLSEQIECRDGQVVVCPVCNGAGVIKKPGLLGTEVYSSCVYGENGTMSCEDYKLYVKGDLAPKLKNP